MNETPAPEPRDDSSPKLNWSVIAPVGLLVLAVLAIVWLGLTTGGEAKPDPFLGAIGTPIRGTFVPDTPTPQGAEGTPRPRPTFVGNVQGTPLDRDAQRRGDLIRLLIAANEYREDNDGYPSTGGNLQTVCVFLDDDVGCDLAEYLEGGELPVDPFGDPIENGYWFESNGESVKIYAALELEITDEERCPTNNVDLREKPSLICIEGP
jgi:hypothetical protein